MVDMFVNAVKLFFKGKLFRDPIKVTIMWLTGLMIATLALVVLVKVGAPLWLSVSIVATGVGALQPYICRNLKYN